MAGRRLRCTVSCTMDDRRARRPHLPLSARPLPGRRPIGVGYRRAEPDRSAGGPASVDLHRADERRLSGEMTMRPSRPRPRTRRPPPPVHEGNASPTTAETLPAATSSYISTRSFAFSLTTNVPSFWARVPTGRSAHTCRWMPPIHRSPSPPTMTSVPVRVSARRSRLTEVRPPMSMIRSTGASRRRSPPSCSR